MAENVTWTKGLWQFAKRAAIGVLGLVALYALYVTVVMLGWALGLWSLNMELH
jgi:hypothetical protein